MKPLRSTFIAFVIAVCASFLALPAFSQPAGNLQVIAPLTRDLGAIRTLTTQGAATVTSADQSGFNVTRVICFFNQSASGGTPSTTWSIQNKDAASGAYYSLITSAALTTTPTNTSFLAAGAGSPVTTNLSDGRPIARNWRVSMTVAGSSTPTVTGTIGCSVQ